MLNSLGRLHGEMEAEDWCPDIRSVHVDGPAVEINIRAVTQKKLSVAVIPKMCRSYWHS